MILPQTYLQCLLLLIVGALCLGSWAATFRASGKWRFELYYVDFAIGIGIATLIYCFTLGNLGFDGFGIVDDLLHAGKRQWLYAFTAGVTFNLANMFIVGAISVAGMAVGMMLGAGLGVIAGVGIAQMFRTGTNAGFMGGALLLFVVAIALTAAAYMKVMADLRAAAPPPDPARKRPRRQPGAMKGILISLLGGVLMSGMYALFGRSLGGEVGLGPYTAVALFVAGVVSSTFVFSMFFMNLPLQGEPVELIEYVRAGAKPHLLGLLGGVLWCTGFLATAVPLAAPPEAMPQRLLVYSLLQAAPLLGAAWGFAVFREFRTSARAGFYAMLGILLAAGSVVLALLSSAKPS